MSIESMIQRNTKQICVYWGNPVNDGDGGKIFDPPIEVSCRWENKLQLITDKQGNEIISKSVIYIAPDQDLGEEGMLWLGTLNDLGTLADVVITVGNENITVDDEIITVDDENITVDDEETTETTESNPKQVEDAFVIKRFDKIPDLKDTGFLRKAYL